MAPVSTIAVVEDHGLFREALVAALELEDGLRVVAAAADLAEFAITLQGSAPDVVVTDLALGGDSGVAVAELAKARGSSVLFITGRGDRRGVEAAVGTGSDGFVSKNATIDDLVHAIRIVAAGGAVFPPELLRDLERGTPDDSPGLTPRETEVLQLLAEARTAGEIAETLALSPHTARNHVRSVLTKLGARSQLEAVVIGVREQLVAID